jgi:hypothetical protein
VEEVMEELAELMQRLLEIQSGGRKRSPELIVEDQQLMDGLHEKTLANKATLNDEAYPSSVDGPEKQGSDFLNVVGPKPDLA